MYLFVSKKCSLDSSVCILRTSERERVACLCPSYIFQLTIQARDYVHIPVDKVQFNNNNNEHISRACFHVKHAQLS